MGKLINPKGLPPEQAYLATLDALVEQLQTRSVSVETGEKHMRQSKGKVIPMPSAAGIFETQGAWEDYSTPSRDMRLLIAMKVLDDMPDQIVRHPELYALGSQRPADAKADIQRLREARLPERTVSYTRSDGSSWTLSLTDIFQRRAAFESGYNPNDCAEVRWGARPGTPEYAPCNRHAPSEQRTRMEQYRVWFRETRRPAR
jgi:hypothetical protein